MHEHVFAVHVGIAVFGGTGTAWVDERLVDDAPNDAPRMHRCVACGEQGYSVPALVESTPRRWNA